MSKYTQTANGAVALKSTGSTLVDLFYNIGTARKDTKTVSSIFDVACLQDIDTAAAILLWSRDIRHGGAGERNVFRVLFKELIESDEDVARKVLNLIPTIGRYDDLSVAYGTALEKDAVTLWGNALRNNDAIAFKWADRGDKVLRKAMGFQNEAEFRKFISKGRKNTIVEEKMCAQNWSMIEFGKLPSVAGIRYAKAFKKNDESRYTSFITNKDTKVNSAVNYPHDVFRAYKYGGQADAASKYWDNLAQLNIEGNILVIPDVSGSMCCEASGKIQCIDIAVSLGAYLSQQIKGHFHNKLITFSETPTLVTLPKSKDIKDIFSFIERMEWGGSTNFQAAYEAILHDAVKNKVSKEYMPSHILVLSDMQFNPIYENGYGNGGGSLWNSRQSSSTKKKVVHASMKDEFAKYGYDLPKIVYWNLSAGSYKNFPVMKNEGNVATVSGFSPQVLKAILAASEFTPESCMEEAIKPFKEMLSK